MVRWVQLSRRQGVIFSAMFLVLLALSSPLLAAGPAAAQNGPSISSGPRIWLQENQPLPVQHVGVQLSNGQDMALADALALAGMGQSQPVSLTAGDLDADGFDDLVVGYSAGSGGFISIHRGNIDAFAPQSEASFQAIGRGAFPSPFYLEAKTFSVPVRPDFIALGDFTGRGNKDLAIAARGGSAVYIFAGDGKGNFAAPQTVNLPGGATSLAAGEFGSRHQSTLIVGASHGTSFALYVFGASPQGLTPVAAFLLNASPSNILFGEFGDPGPDAAFLIGGQIQILRSSTMQLATVSLPVSVRAFALGSFIYDRNPSLQIALLAVDGSIQIAVHNEFDPRSYSNDELKVIRQGAKVRTEANPLLPQRTFPVNGWRIVESFPGVASLQPGQSPVLFRTRVSSNGNDDVMLLNPFGGQLALISHADVGAGANTFLPGQVSLRPYSGSPIAALPMRINVDGRPGVIALHKDEIAPSAIFPIPDPTFFVNRTDDPAPPQSGGVPVTTNICNNISFGDTSSDCSLREAVIKANATAGTDTIMLQGTTYTLTIARNAADHHTSLTGTLEVQDSVNIIGAGQSSTIVQGGTNLTTSMDKVFSFNQDIDSFTNATVSISNFTIQNGHNRGDCCATQDGFGGAFDFDTGGTGNNNLTVTNMTIKNNAIFDGQGGGFTIFNTNNGSGTATVTNSIVQNNSGTPNSTGGVGDGGGIVIDARSKIIITNSQIINNTAGSGGPGPTHANGGGLALFGQHTQPQSAIHASLIGGNSAAGTGGGMLTNATLLIDQGTIISNNTAGNGGANGFGGGGIINNSNDGLTLTMVTIINNSTTGNGGGIFTGNTSGGVPITMSFSRLTGNSSTLTPGSSNLYNLQGTITVTNNWWGTNTPSGTIVTNAGTTTFTPWINLTHTAGSTLLRIGDATTLTADFLHRNTDPLNSPSISASSLNVFSGLPVTFNNNAHGNITNAQPFIENQVNISTVSESGCASPPVVPCTATVTVTTSTAHGFSTGQSVTIAGVTDPTYDGVFTIASTPTTTTFTYSTSDTNTTSSSGGTASVPTGKATATYTATSGGIDHVHAVVDGFAANVDITVLFPPQISKAFSATHIPVFSVIPTVATLTFTITNPNTANSLNGLAFTDNLPSGLQVANTPNASTTCTGGTVTANAGSGTISLSGGTISFNAGGTFTCTVTVDVKGTADGVQNNTSGNVTATDAGGLTGNTATASITVINPAHIVKAFGATKIPLNGTTSLTFTIDSNSNQNLTLNGVAFTDSLPAGLINATPSNVSTTCTNGTATAADGGSTVSLSGAKVDPNTNCTVSVTVKGTTAGDKNNSVQVTSTDVGGLTGNTATATITVVAPPTISKAFNPTSIPLNGTTTVTFTISNPNNPATPANGDLTGVAFSDTLPVSSGPGTATLVVASTPNLSNTCGGTVTGATGGSGVISLSGGSVTHNTFCTLSVDVKGTVEGDANNTTGAISSTEGGTGTTSNTATLKVVAPPTISKAFGATSIPLNGTTTMTFTVTNPGSNTSAENGIAFSDTLTNGLQIATTPGLSNTCGGTVTGATSGSTTISLSGGSIATPGTTCTVVVNVTGTQSGTVTNTTGAVSSTNGGTGATSNTATLIVVSPPTVTKTFAPTKIPLNGTTLLTINISNPNSGSSLTGLAFTDSLPAGLVVASTPNLNNTCGGTATATGGASTVSLSGGTLASSASCAVSVNVQGTTAGDKSNSVTVSSTEGGNSNTPTATVTVVAPPTISKAFGSGSIPLNGTTTVTFTITNPNNPGTPANGDLTGVAFSDTLPVSSGPGTATLVVASTPNLSNTCGGTVTGATGGSGVISLSGGSVTHNTFCTLSVNVTGTAAGDANNTTGAISSTEGGTGTTSNTALIKIVAPPTISKAFGAANISLNGTTTMTFTITNPAANTTAENGIAFSDTLTNGLQIAATPGLSNTCGGTVTGATSGSTTISLSGGSIATPGTTCTVVVNVTGTQSGTVSNTTGAVSSTNGGTGNTSNTATLIVAKPPTSTKAFTLHQIPLNGTTTLTINITNPNTNVTLTGVGFTDSFPAGLVVAPTPNASNTCGGTFNPVAGAGSATLSGGTLAATASCTVKVDVQGTTAGGKSNSVTVSSTEGGSGSAASDNITVAGPPTVLKSFADPSVALNVGTTTMSFQVSNPNTSAQLTGIGFTDNLPAGLQLTSTTVTGSCPSGTITPVVGPPSSVTLSGATLAASGSCTFSLTVKGTSVGTKNNTTSTVSSNEGGTGTAASASVNVDGPPTIAKAFNPIGIPPNGVSTLTITITNPAANPDAAAGVAFTDNLPTNGSGGNLVVATPNGLTNSCGGTATATAGSGSVSLTGGSVNINSSCAVTVNVTAANTGSYLNTTGAVSSTTGGTGGTASATLSVAFPPTISKVFVPDTIFLGATSVLSFTINNPNSNSTAPNADVTLTGIGFADTLPAGLVIAPTPSVSNDCGGVVTAVAGSNSITLTGGSLAPAVGLAPRKPGAPLTPAAGSCFISVKVKPNTTGTFNNTSGPITSDQSGPGTTSNQATLTVNPPPNPPTISKAFGAASIPLNGTTSLTFNFSNPNNNVAFVNVSMSDTLPGGLVVGNPNGLTGSCVANADITASPGSSTISMSNLNLPANGSCSFSVNVTGTGAGTKNNASGNVTATFDDGSGTFVPITGGNATATLIVVAPPAIAKAFNPSLIAPNTTSTLSFTITNPAANTVAENGVAFTDTLPANLVVATPNGAVGTCNGGTLTAVAGSGSISLTGGTIPVGSSCTLSVNVTSSVPGTYNNNVRVSATNGGTGNTASATLKVANASLSITKTHSGNFSRGRTGATYTITVSNAANAGPTVGTVTVTDTLPNVPNTLVPTALSGTGWTCNLGTLTCTRSDVLAPGGSYPAITLTVNVPINIQANVTNSATVSGGGDPNSHTANDPTHIGPPIQVVPAGAGNSQVLPGGSTSMSFTVDSTAGEGTVNMSCSGLPPGVTCSFNPPSTNQLTTTVTLTMTAAGNSSLLPGDNRRTPPLYAAIFPLLGLAGMVLTRKRSKAARLRLALVFAGIMMLLTLAGCGGRTTQPALAGSFPLTVTATSPTTGDSGSTTITLNVL